MNMHKSERVQQAAEQLYQTLSSAGVEVLFDDRKERPGVMFSDMELIGIPHTIIIGDRSMDDGCFEYKARRTGDKTAVKIEDVVSFLQQKLTA